MRGTARFAALRALLVMAVAAPAMLAAAKAHAGQAPVRLLDAGSQPRQALRPRYAPAYNERVMVEGRSLLEGSSSDRPELQSLESMERFTLALSTESIEPDGTARVRFEIIAATMSTNDPRRTAEEIDQVAGHLVGTTGWWRLDSRGAVIEAAATARPGVPERITQGVARNMGRTLREGDVPLPVEAVGVGARWVQEIDTLISPKHTMTYELRALVDDVAHIDIVIAGSAEPDSSILEHRITGRGSMTFDPRRLLPALSVESDMAMRTLPGVNTPAGPRIATGRLRSSRSVVPLD